MANQYQIFCLRKQHGPLSNMCVAVVQDGLRHDRTVQPSSRFPDSWGQCCHSSIDILPVMINASCQSSVDRKLEKTEGAPPSRCPFLSEMEVKRHGKLIVHDLKESGRLAREAKRRSSGGESAPSVHPPGTKLQRQSWALLTVKVSYEINEKSEREIGTCGLDPSNLIQLQSDLVAEVRPIVHSGNALASTPLTLNFSQLIKLGIRDFKGLVVPQSP